MTDSKKIVEFTIVYNNYKNSLYNYILKMIGIKEIAEDIVQNTFMKFFQSYEIIKDKSKIKFWLFTTTRNQIFAYYKTKKSHVDKFNTENIEDMEVISGNNIEDEFDKKELRQLIKRELENVPEEQKEIFYLREYGELSYSEIADLINIDKELVKSRLYKVRQKIIKRVSEHYKGV